MSSVSQDFWNLSGAALNIKRPSTKVTSRKRPKKPQPPGSSPPKPKRDYPRKTSSSRVNSGRFKKTTQVEKPAPVMTSQSKSKAADGNFPRPDNEEIPRIDLINFDCLEFENSKYVLTSPRSLEACNRHNILPMELLYKHLQEFEEEFPRLPVSELLALYDKHEAQRKEKLRRVRMEREKIIDEDREQGLGIGADASRKRGSRNVSFSDERPAETAAEDPIFLRKTNRNKPQVRSASTSDLSNIELKDFTDTSIYGENLGKEGGAMKFQSGYKKVYSSQGNIANTDNMDGSRSVEYYDEPRYVGLYNCGKFGGHSGGVSHISKNRAKMDQEFDAYNDMILKRHQQMLEKAERGKRSLEEQAARRREEEQRRREQEHSQRMASLKNKAEEDSFEVRAATAERERQARENHEKMIAEKERHLRQMAQEKLKKIKTSAQKRQELNKELEDFRRQLKVYRELAQQKAVKTVERRVAAVAASASDKESSRQRLAQRNLRERNHAEAAWRLETERAIAERNRAAEYKRKIQDEYRAAAAAISAYSNNRQSHARSDSFDKLVHKAELVNKLGLGQELR